MPYPSINFCCCCFWDASISLSLAREDNELQEGDARGLSIGEMFVDVAAESVVSAVAIRRSVGFEDETAVLAMVVVVVLVVGWVQTAVRESVEDLTAHN